MNDLNNSELDSLLLNLRSRLPEALAGTPVVLAYLFGSLLDGTALPGSDVDIAIVLAPETRLSNYERMQLEFSIAAKLEEFFSGREVDVRVINTAPLTVRGRILTKGELIYSRDEDFRVDYEVYTRKRYFDFQPVEEMMRKAFFEGLREKGLFGDKS